MFIGEYAHTIDAKGRVAIPTKFRAPLIEGVVVTRGLDQSLFLFTPAEWQKLVDKLVQLPLASANARAFVRLMLAGAMDVNLDAQGRIIIPGYLRSFAGLKKEAVVVGLYNRLEIWSKENWQNYKEKAEQESGELAEKLQEWGI